MSDSEQIPSSVTRLLSARYPTLDIDPTWLRNCVRRLRQRSSASAQALSDQLAREVRRELLDTDLANVVTPSYSRLTPQVLRSSSGKVGDASRGAILVQIESIIDIGYSASSQLEIAEARREARRANVDPNHVAAETEAAQSAPPPSGSDHMADFQAHEDDKVQASTLFPRRMLKLELSDGSICANVTAIEMQRIAGLDMNTTRIGSKLLLKGVLVKDDHLLLTPKTVVVEGGVVKEKDQVAEDKLITRLRSQLGKPPLVDKAPSLAQDASNGDTAAPQSSNKEAGAVVTERDFSPDEDESMLLAMLADEDHVLASASKQQHPRAHLGTPPPPTRKRTTLILPEGVSQSSVGKTRSEKVDATVKPKATPEDPISLIESEDEDLFASIPDSKLSGAMELAKGMEEEYPTLSNSRNDPIVIESSPEP